MKTCEMSVAAQASDFDVSTHALKGRRACSRMRSHKDRLVRHPDMGYESGNGELQSAGLSQKKKK
jgi:hypothetical protein